MRKHSTHSISRVFFSLLMLMIAGVNLTMAQGLSSNDIKASWDFKNGTVAYSIVSADIPAGSTFAWNVDSKSVTDGISDSGQTITLPLTNKTRSGDVTITSADNTSQTIAFSIEPKAYGVDYDGNHFYADSYQLYPDGTEGDGSKEKPYLISNDLELARLAHEVNNGTELQMFSQKYFKLTKDIDLSKGLWTPIGTAQGIAKASDGHFFAGKFDGDGHSVSNLLIKWSFNTAKEASWGLFARLNGKGNNEHEYAAVTNLIIDNALIEKLEAHMPLNNANYTVKMGIVVADMTQNAELSNIIIRNSKITDNNESFSTKTKFRIGGIAGYLNNFVSLRIFNISADTEIDVFRNAALNGVEGQVTISCGFGAASKLANQTGYVVWPRNIYVHGAGLKTSANTTQCKKASVMAFIAADNFASKVKDTWYYTPANKAANTYTYNQYGVEKDISATDATTGEPFGKTFAGLNNLYINQNNLDKRPWLYSNSSKRFSFSSIALKAERGTSDVLTVTTEDGETTSDVYNWYASTDNTEGEKVNSTACNPFTLPRQTYSQYVYAMTVDGSQRTNTVLVEAIGITAELDYDTKPGTYIVNVKNDTKENFTNDELGLDITYEWHDKETLLSETSNEFVRPETATNKNQYNCTVTVKSGGNIIFHKNIKVTIVVYLCPEAVSINGTTYAQGEDNDDEEWGYSPTQAMKTWKGAYSKLSKTGTWDENIIVLMGTSHTDVTNNQYTGFNITSNNRGKSILKFDDWANAKGESTLFRNATITGDWDGTDYKGTIEIYGAEKGLPIWGDTRFEYITFNNDPVTNNGGDFYKIIYCQYNSLEMGEGIQMTGFGQNSPNYGTIDGAVTTAFHIFGGFNNDGRFFPLSNKKNISDFEQSMPHGKEGFKISIKSGFYSAISAGGRQTSSEKDYNGVMGTPNLPIKCTIEMDIDRKWNDAHNPERKIKGETSKRKSDYDAGIILAGSHEGAMYTDVDIIIRSGKVARVVNGSLGAQRDFILPYNGTDYYVPNNTYMGRANILLDPASSKHNNDEWIDNRVIVTELYGGSTGRGHTGNVIVNNPFYGYSTITINGGVFEILPAGNTKTDNIFCGIYGAGAGGMNGIGEGDDNADSHTPDKSIAYWNESGDVMLYGPYAVAKDRLVTYHCYNNDDFESFTDVDPTNTNTKIVINGGEFGSTTDPIDGIYGGGSGFMSKGLWSSTAATPNKCGGNVYGKVGATVASITINGGEFHCTNGIFAGGRGTDFFYSQNPYGGNSGNYKALGKTYGNVELNINGGIFYCPVFGGGYGVADAKEMGTSNVETLSDMARLYGQSSVNIMGGTFYKNIYGGGDMAIVEFDGNATNVVIGDSADIRGSVFAGGNGRRLRPASQAFAAGDGFTQHPELVGLVAGNANVSFAGSTQQAPFIYGDIFGGGNLAQVANDTYVNIYAGNIAGQVFGGGNGDITDGTVTSADVLGNTNVTLAQDEGGTQNVGHGPIDDSFSINVIWFKMWDPVENIFYIWDPDIDDAGDEPATEDTVYEKSKFYADGKFLNPHNIYGGGNLACNVGTYKDADGNVTTTPADGTGLATVMMQKGMTPYELLTTDEWKQSYTDNENPHFSVFGGGYGRLTTVGSTDVTVNVDGDYGKNGPGPDGNIDPNAPSLDNSMGAPNFTVWAVLGGGYAGTVAGNTKVTVDGKTFIRRVFGGGFGDIASTEDNTTGQIGGNTEVYMRGAFTHGDVFGGSAGLKPETASSTHFITVARVIGTTMVEVADDANIYGNVYGGGDNANVGIFQEMKPSDYYSPDLLTSASTLNQADGSFISYKAEGYRSFVNIRGGNIFGNVYGGGVGCKKAEANQYYNIGRINGNTLVHIVNSNPGVDSGIDNVVPCVWGDIYGGCEYGTVDGNTLVHIEGGMLGKNVYGGGYGDIDIDSELTVDKEVLGKKDIAGTGTYADILGNTKVQIDGGSWIWNRKADSNGNITTWLDAESDSSPICKDNNEFRKIAYAIDRATSLDNIGDPLAQNAIDRIRNNENTKKFFDLDRFTFTNSYNIFGGGNRACHVGSASVANTGKSVVIINHSPLDDIKDSKGKTISMFENTTLQGLCWFMNSIYVSNPSFSVFGAGYGVNTSVGKTEVYAQPGAKFDDDGLLTINGIKYRYLYQNNDFKTYLDLEDDIYNDYLKLSKEDKKLYFGSYDGGESDPNIFRRYHISRLAWKIGEPGLVLLQIHGGGYAGYVTGDTYVETDCQLGCHDIFGAGLGALPYGDYTDGSGYDFGSVKGKSMVFIKGGDVNHSVYGGGSGVESVKKNGGFIDFPDMAHVEKTEVHIYGKMFKYRNGLGLIERTLIFGRVYGGGDLANVGSKKADAAVFTRDNYLSPTNRTTLVNIRGGSLMSQVFAGGRGRSVRECADSKSLGGVYGNSCLIIDRPVMHYPYWDDATKEYLSPNDDANMVHPVDIDNYPTLMERIYGGCQNGTVYGNTLLTIYDGWFGQSAHGGGLGSVETITENGSESVAVTSADVTGNTNLLILGGNVQAHALWDVQARTWSPASIVDGTIYSPQYDPKARKFKVDHNIYGGGNIACVVGNNSYLTMTKGLLYNSTEMVAGRDTGKNFFESIEWKEIYEKIGTPQFSVFGGGFGENAIVMGDTYVNVEMEGRGSILEGIDIVKGEEYKHFFNGYSVMDIIGGGYSGKVVGDTHIVGSGGVFCRRVFGGGTYSSVNSTDVELKAIDCHDIFGGGFMGDVLKSTTVRIGDNKPATSPHTYSNADIFIHGNVYGGNDVSGYVNVGLNKNGYFMDNGGTGTTINIYGGHLFGDVYGAGNGNYLYATDRNGNKNVTVNEYYPVNPNDPDSETVPLVYTVPMRENMTQSRATSDAVKMVNINSWRPLTNKVSINIQGVSTSDTVRIDGNVYGGCFKSGTIVGDVLINLQSDMLAGKDKDKLEKSNELLVKAAEYSALNVYGAGYGMESYIYGIANVTIGESVKCSEPKMDGNKFLPCGVVDPDSNPEGLGVSANFIYGGGQQGNVVGYSTIKMLNGHIFRAVTGGSYSGYVYGSTQVIVGYPTYYSTNRQNHVRGRYELKRADRKNLGVENDNGKEKTPAIKQHIYLLNDEWISQGVYEDIVAIDNGNGMRDTITDANRAHYFKKIVSAAPSVGWENVNITIDEAVYGGGYSVAQGSVLANNTTVLKLTDKYNLDYAIIANGNGDDLNLLPGGSTAGFCGNTLVVVGDNKDSEHITISHQDIRPVQLPDGTDLYGYYYKHYASDDDAANGIYTYRYISLQDKYFFKSGATPPSGLEGIRENEFYEYDSEGGIFGDGHLSYAQGFRSADLTGYGFAEHTIDNPKILNTFQRLDIIRLEDNCFSLLGARDYTVNNVDKTPYSIARVGEIKMVANDIRFDSNGNLEAKPDNNTDFRYSTKARNYMGFSNNILYVSAITSNVDFNSGMWRNRNGQLAAASTDNTAFAGMSYQGVKQHYIDDYNANKDKEDTEDPFGEFQKRNDGTAMNMIGIASGYAMKIQLCHETYDSDRKKVVENKLYGPIYGVVEMNLINVREDEGGGYVYADNNHKRHDGDSHEEDFLETTGNFVFPYHKGRYIVDDCFPTGYHAITAPGSDKTVDDVKVHYWYVTGFHYYYNVNISGYTFKSSKENPLEFDSDNKDGLTVLAGLKSTQPISIFNWKMRSGHPDDKSQYSSDLEYRNYLTGTETNETDKTYYSDAVAGGYKLYVGGAESNNFSGATSIDDPDKASKGFAALLSMREKGDDEATLFNNSLPAGLKEDAKISFRLVDMVDNTNYIEPDYFDKHLGRKSMATLVLKAPAYEEYVSETDNKPIYTNTGKFYKKTETGYELVESGNLDADNTYYQPQTEEFVKIESLFTYDTANKTYEKVDNISNVTIDESNPTIYYVPREYTYTIYLTIEYVQGPTVSGQITIGNCALPGEMVRVTKDNIVVSADQSFAVNGYYWRIGKRQMGADGKWKFKDTTPWTKENISNNVATGYDTFNQADENGKGLFAGCHYDKTDDLLDVPVYYYMNGYGIQLGVSITGLNDILEVGMHDADKFVVHNYHRMDPHKAGINLHLAEAITRVNEESLDTTESDPLPEPRIYISDKSDLSALVAFVDSIGTDSNAPRYGAKAQFFLQNDIALEATDKGGYYISDFAGILHGDGHVISGIPSGKSLFNNIESSGNIYNLGLASGKISNLTADGKIGNYHCCFEYAPASGKSGSTPVVYRWDGSPDKGYTTEDFRLGRVAYDLNEYYLRARHRDAATTSSTEADADNEILKYVSAYYANGDYQYACRTDAITGKNTGITYLRIGKGGDTPNYEQVETRHDKTHPLDAPRVKYNADGSIPTPVVYTPLFNANNSGTEPMNDFLFWGQSLQHNPDNYPCDIASHQNSYMSNRVYRTAAYYGDTSLDAFHYNAYSNGSITMSTYVHDSATTAVDFTCLHDLPAATETVGGIFYPPMDDNASRFNDFVVKEDAGITQNLLVYTADNDEATGNEAYDVVEKALNYNETTREALINGHHITKGIDGYSTTLLHLVERTPDNENGDGETCNNNNLCVPIAFNVNDRAWYVRRPLHYAEDSKGAWEGICLPFTVDKVAASLNGEITHFYGSPSDTETGNPSQNIHSLHHEYWLRGLTSIATEGNVPSAVFQRPGAALFSPTDASGNALTNGVSYTFANTFFVDNYADKLYNQYANPYYATAHNYPDYLRLAGEVPYIVRFPGARYYEFDLSSAFYNDIFGAWEDAQTVTFNAYGDNHTGDTSYGAITIPITKGMATMVGGKYSHLGTFSAINVSNGNVYGMNDSGTAFDDASSLSTVTPFRTYMSPTATRSNARYDYTSVINIAEQNADNIMPDMEENEDDTQTEDHITVRAIGNQRVRIESTMATRLNVVTVAGQLYRILDVQPGIATYSDFQPGLYIFGTTKVIVR